MHIFEIAYYFVYDLYLSTHLLPFGFCKHDVTMVVLHFFTKRLSNTVLTAKTKLSVYDFTETCVMLRAL